MSRFYKATTQERVDIGALLDCDVAVACEWLANTFKEPEKGIYGESLSTYADEGRRLLEYLLIKRRDPLIDHFLARYGYSIYAIQKAYDRGGASTRSAALSNIRGGIRLRDAGDILKHGRFREVRQILHNKWLQSDTIAGIISRQGWLSEVENERFYLLIEALRGNERLYQPYASLTLDGYDEYRYNRVFYASWSLPAHVPLDQRWAALLWSFLSDIVRSGAPDNLDSMIERWKVDDEPDKLPAKWWERSPSFNLRVLLYDFKKADESLLQSQDGAARMSFYKRFSPFHFKDWTQFLEVDGEEFTHAALENKNLWRDSEERSRLSSVCWNTPDETHHMDLPNDFRWKQRRLQEAHPDWFIGDNTKKNDAFKTLDERLSRIENSLEKLANKRGLFG